MHSNLCLWFVRLLFGLCVLGFGTAEDSYGVWYKTLRPLQSHACDRQELRLACTSSTIISVHYVWYGRQRHSDHLCPGLPPAPAGAISCNSNIALQVIQEKCHGKRMCRLYTAPETFRDDPCPGVGKFAEVIYKCRPETFQNKFVCEGDSLHLNCSAGQGLTIYSAMFGTVKPDPGNCPQPQGYAPKDCLVGRADELVRSFCSGKQNCSLRADHSVFGNTNCEGTKHLKVTYNCIENGLLLLPSGRPAEEDVIYTTSFPAWVRGLDSGTPPPRLRPTHNSYKLEMQSDEVPLDARSESRSEDPKFVGFMSKVMTAHKYVEVNRDKLILYVTVSVAVGFLVCLTVLGSRMVIRRLAVQADADIEMTAENEDQFFSDSDMEHFDLPPELLPPPPVIDYTASMRRKSSDMVPRTPVAETGPGVEHYFS